MMPRIMRVIQATGRREGSHASGFARNSLVTSAATACRTLRRLLRAPAIGLSAVLFSGLSALPLHAGYHIDNVKLPAELRGGITGVAFTPAGSLALCTRYGEIWLRDPSGERWHLFARGLNEPMGLVAESERVIYVAHRPELLRCTDTDGDGRADTFDVLGGQWGLTQNYHEFFFGVKRDRAGDFYGAVSLQSTGANAEDRNAVVPVTVTRGSRNSQNVLDPTFHRSEVPWRGWAVRIGADGKFEPFASGFRQPNGVGLSPEDDLFITDNQGDYKPTCGLIHVEKGDFLGHASSLKWQPGIKPEDLTTEALWRRYKSPAVVFPYGPIGVSSGEPVWDLTGGKFGPFTGQVFVGDYSRFVARASLEKIAGGWQGACFPFLGRNETAPYFSGEKLIAAPMRAAFAPDGSLYLGATAGWGAGADGVQRVTWDGIASPDIQDVKLTDRGFRIEFTRAMDPASLVRPGSYEMRRFRYYYQWKYGSPEIDEARVEAAEIRAAPDGRAVELAVNELAPGFVYEFSLAVLRTVDGQPLGNSLGYYTANRLRNGASTIGGTTRLPQPGEDATGEKEALKRTQSAEQIVAAGEKVYRLYCVACHQPDGHGIPGGAANFVDDKTRLAKADAQLLDTIARGSEAKGMPAFGAVLTLVQRRSALAYIRHQFGDKITPDSDK